jgi:LPXTG-motif cell wall-anchored protein
MALGLGFSAISAPVASAVPTNAVSFGCFNNPGAGCPAASFNGYASGDEVHLGAVTVSNTSLADVEEGYSGATTNSHGLASPVVGDNGGLSGTGLLVQPVKSSSNRAFGTGAGLQAGLAAPADASADQLKLAGLASQVAPPNGAADIVSIPNASCPETNGVPQCLQLPSGLAAAGALSSEGAAVYDSAVCPLGQPLSYGFGDAADASLVSFSDLTPITSALSSALSSLGITVPTSGNVIQNLGDARTTSETYLAPNGDGSFGLSTRSQLTIAPVSINLFGAADLELEVGGALNSNGTANPAVPISLTASATGESSGAKLSLGANDVVSLSLVVQGTTTTILPATSLDDLVGQGGLVLNLDPQTLLPQLATAITNNPVLNKLGGLGGTLGSVVTQVSNSLQPITGQLPNVSLGEIAIGTPVRAINSDPGAKTPGVPAPVGTASASEGTTASGAFDLARVSIAPAANGTTTPLLNFYVGHLEAAANLTAPILCNLPIIKAANPTAVTAGDSFVYNIQVPDPAKLDLIDCNLSNVTVTDTITDAQGTPSFTVTSARDVATGAPGTIQTISPNKAIVTWTGLSYTVAPTGQPPNAPIPLTIAVSVPATSTSGVIQDTVVANATVSGCQGGAATATDTSATAANGAALTGMFTLQQPSVAAAATTPAGASPASKSLPLTGAMGGLWQPLGGLGALAVGGGALYLVRRSRRLGAR